MDEKRIAAMAKDGVFDDSFVISGIANTAALAAIITVLLGVGVNQLSLTKRQSISHHDEHQLQSCHLKFVCYLPSFVIHET